MADDDTQKLQALLKNEILSETAKIPWSELQRFFAGGKAIYVADDLDLIEVALQISNDNTDLVGQWMADHKLVHVSDAQAVSWCDDDAVVWAVVVKPWVLVQDADKSHEH